MPLYNPASFRRHDLEDLSDFIDAHPLGLLVTHGTDGLDASSIPFRLYREEGDHGVLRAHVARANPQWKVCAAGGECLVVFQGAQGYVTPSWYASKAEHHRVVPTWNYTMVQCRGTPQVVHEAAWLHRQIADLTDVHEGGRTTRRPWAVSDAPADFIDAQVQAIVGIELPIRWIEGKFKLSQNRPAPDQVGVVEGMSDPGDPHHNPEVAALVRAAGEHATPRG